MLTKTFNSYKEAYEFAKNISADKLVSCIENFKYKKPLWHVNYYA